jgi:hypothetical protein
VSEMLNGSMSELFYQCVSEVNVKGKAILVTGHEGVEAPSFSRQSAHRWL